MPLCLFLIRLSTLTLTRASTLHWPHKDRGGDNHHGIVRRHPCATPHQQDSTVQQCNKYETHRPNTNRQDARTIPPTTGWDPWQGSRLRDLPGWRIAQSTTATNKRKTNLIYSKHGSLSRPTEPAAHPARIERIHGHLSYRGKILFEEKEIRNRLRTGTMGPALIVQIRGPGKQPIRPSEV